MLKFTHRIIPIITNDFASFWALKQIINAFLAVVDHPLHKPRNLKNLLEPRFHGSNVFNFGIEILSKNWEASVPWKCLACSSRPC